MKKRYNSEIKQSRMFSIVFSVLFCGVALFLFIMLRENAYRSETAMLEAASEKVALQVSEKLSTMLDVGERIQALLIDNTAIPYAVLKPVAEENLEREPSIKAITIAPGAIIRYSFPENAASDSIGHDLLDSAERMQSLVHAVSSKKAVLQGPTLSAEGFQLAFLRIPVFVAQELWGFVSISFDAQQMMEELQIRDEFPSLRIAIGAKMPEDRLLGMRASTGTFFWGNEKAYSGHKKAIEIQGIVGEWEVAAASLHSARNAVWWGFALLLMNIATSLMLLTRRQPPEKPLAKGSTPIPHEFEVHPFIPQQEIVQSETPPAVENSAHREEPPIERKEVPPEENKISSDAVIEMSPAENISVLVVDDSEVNCELFLRMLTLKGYQAQSVSSGDRALALLRERKFDILLIDCVMPEFDGYSLAREISKIRPGAKHDRARFQSPAMIAMSPSHDLEEAKKCADVGFDGLIIKPFTMTSLDQKIKEILNSSADRAK